ncbi:MAG: FHA domain-containing protein [Anaerolineae bacterium]
MKKVKKALIAIVLLATLFSGGQRLMAQETINLVIKNFVNDDYPNLSFEITPSNEFGVPIEQLTAAEFNLSDDAGRLEAIVSERVDDDEPIAIMLLIDASGSMQQSGRLSEIQNQAIQFRESLNQFDQMGVLFFNIEEDNNGRRVELFPAGDAREFAPSLDGGGAINFINQFAAGDDLAGTPLYDAMFRSVQVLARDTLSERRAVIVITDSVDHAQGALVEDQADGDISAGSIHADMDIVITAAQQENIAIFTIGLNGDDGPTDEAPFSGVDAVELTKIARSTGGSEAIDQSATEVFPLLATISDQLKTKYSVTTQALTKPDNLEHTLTVQVNSKLGTSEAEQSFRALYPFQPIIELSYADNEDELYDASRLAAGVQGTIEFRPSVFARNSIIQVEYFIEDDKVHVSTEPPFIFRIDTSRYFNRIGILTDLKVVAIDSSATPNVGEYEQDMLILDCGLTCLAAENNFTTLDTNTFIAIWVALLLLILLLIFFIVFSIIRRRRRKAVEAAMAAQAYGVGAYQYPMPVIPKTDEQINVGPLAGGLTPVQPPQTPAGDTIVDSSFTPNGPNPSHNSVSDPDGSTASPATEVLDRPPSRLAFLFNPNNGQQHQLNETEITVGRLPENQICMPDASVSGKHAVIKIENDSYVIYDLGASNPVMINGQALFGSHPLSNGDQVTLGREDWIFKELDQ